STVGRRHRRHIDVSRIRIDHRRASDAERIHISAGKARARDRISNLPHPNLGTSNCVERQYHILLGRDNKSRFTTWAVPRVEGLSVNGPWKRSVKRLVPENSRGGFGRNE